MEALRGGLEPLFREGWQTVAHRQSAQQLIPCVCELRVFLYLYGWVIIERTVWCENNMQFKCQVIDELTGAQPCMYLLTPPGAASGCGGQAGVNAHITHCPLSLSSNLSVNSKGCLLWYWPWGTGSRWADLAAQPPPTSFSLLYSLVFTRFPSESLQCSGLKPKPWPMN